MTSTVISRFEQQSRQCPDQEAFRSATMEVSYGELNQQANYIAHRLLERASEQAERVAIFLPAGSLQLAALLGVLKAGKVGVVLDWNAGTDSISAIFADAQVGAILTIIDGAAHAFCIPPNCDLLSLNSAHRARTESTNPSLCLESDSPAMLFYTSGSTGKPKGVLWTHKALSFNAQLLADGIVLTGSDRFCFLAAHHSCNGTCNLFRAFIQGATVLGYNLGTQGLPRLAEWLNDQKATVLATPASVFRQFMRMIPSGTQFPHLRLVRLGNEPVLQNDFTIFQKTFSGDCRLVNAYSSTETGLIASYLFEPDAPLNSRSAPMGRPICDVTVQLLNEDGHEVETGEPGEIVVRSPALAAGYWKHPVLTASVFSRTANNTRTYRTGDLARRRADGCLEHIGRRDLRVKVRGFSVELEGVEAVLAEHPDLQAVTVVSVPDDENGNTLVAYVIPARQPAPTNSELRQWVAQRMAPYMVPSSFVLLDEFPRTATSKIDRQILVEAARCPVEICGSVQPPRRLMEIGIVNLWQELFRKKNIDIHDDFFNLGGNSLAVATFCAQWGSRHGIEMEPQLIFEFPTPAQLAYKLEQRISSPQVPKGSGLGAAEADFPEADILEAILQRQRQHIRTWKGKRASSDSWLFTLNANGTNRGLVWCFQGKHEFEQLASHLGPDQPLHGLRSGFLVMQHTPTNLQSLARVYATEVSNLQPVGPLMLGGNCRGSMLAHAMAVELESQGREVDLLILMEAGTFLPFSGRVSLLFGQDSKYNPYRSMANPEQIFKTLYPAGSTISMISGGHGEFFAGKNIGSLSQTILNQLNLVRRVDDQS